MKKFFLSCLSLYVISCYAQVPTSITFQLWYNGKWVNENRNVFFEDSNGFLTKIDLDDWDDITSGWAVASQLQNTYNGDSLLTKVDRVSYYNGAWHPISSAQSYYNSNKKIEKHILQYSDSTWQDSQYQIDYSYDSIGYLVNTKTRRWSQSAGAGSVFATVSYTNNAGGKVIEQLSEESINGGALQKMRLESLTYNGQNNVDVVIEQRWYSGVLQNFLKTVYLYSQSGFLIEIGYYSWDGLSKWNQYRRTVYTNKPDGKIDTVVDQLLSNSWLNNWKYIYDWSPPPVVGFRENSIDELTPTIYFDLNGLRTAKQPNILLIEQRGNVRRKVIFQEY